MLVIDDDPRVLDMLQRSLAKEGLRVHVAPGGEEGLKMARELRPDAITLDVMMPGMDGWAVLAALKSDPELADIPVIMVTIVDDQNMGYALGATEYLTKPIDRERLAAVLKRIVGDGGIRTSALLVEDDPDVRDVTRRVLELGGWSVIEAENGRAGPRAAGGLSARRDPARSDDAGDGRIRFRRRATAPSGMEVDSDCRGDGEGPNGRGSRALEWASGTDSSKGRLLAR